MRKYCTKVLVRTKHGVSDEKSAKIKAAIENYIPLEDLSCIVGTFYLLDFKANNQAEALHTVEKLAREILTNDMIENYEIRSLEEIECS